LTFIIIVIQYIVSLFLVYNDLTQYIGGALWRKLSKEQET